MASILGGEYGRRGNYVPHPVPTYAPEGHRRCDRCNALVKEGDECKCRSRSEVSDKQAVRTICGQTYWDEYIEDASRRRRGLNERVRK